MSEKIPEEEVEEVSANDEGDENPDELVGEEVTDPRNEMDDED